MAPDVSAAVCCGHVLVRLRDRRVPDPQRPGRGLRVFWSDLARPGASWTGAQRVAIADETRRARTCALCAERKEALSPFLVDGAHDAGTGSLPDAAVDAVHRLTTDASRLTRDWVEKLAGSGVSDAHYVELLGVVVATISVDVFHEAMGLPLEPLPTPEAGEPSGYRPASAEPGTGWVPMIPGSKAKGAESDLYPGPIAANVIKAMSLVPDAVRTLKRLSAAQYVPMLQVGNVSYRGDRALGRDQIELVAGRVSALNECFY